MSTLRMNPDVTVTNIKVILNSLQPLTEEEPGADVTVTPVAAGCLSSVALVVHSASLYATGALGGAPGTDVRPDRLTLVRVCERRWFW